MTYKLYIDDLRTPPDDSWVVVRTIDHAIETLKSRGLPHTISFDHDLGVINGVVHEATTVAWFIVNAVLDGIYNIHDLTHVNVHSDNPPGVKNLVGLFASFAKSKNAHISITAEKNGSYIGTNDSN
jgi:hypothetical protein